MPSPTATAAMGIPIHSQSRRRRGAGSVDAHSYAGGHYLTVVGYSNDGATAELADPADANGYGWYWMDTTRLANWIAERGYSA